jgi:hypothetical protein
MSAAAAHCCLFRRERGGAGKGGVRLRQETSLSSCQNPLHSSALESVVGEEGETER